MQHEVEAALGSEARVLLHQGLGLLLACVERPVLKQGRNRSSNNSFTSLVCIKV